MPRDHTGVLRTPDLPALTIVAAARAELDHAADEDACLCSHAEHLIQAAKALAPACRAQFALRDAAHLMRVLSVANLARAPFHRYGCAPVLGALTDAARSALDAANHHLTAETAPV